MGWDGLGPQVESGWAQQDVTSLNSVWVEVKRGRVERRAKSVILGSRGRSRRRWRRCISRGYETVAYRLHPLTVENGARRIAMRATDRIPSPRLTPVGSTDRCHEEAK